jgi:KilA-N domain
MAVQYELALIPHQVDGQVIEQRSLDGYINATAMCRAASKLFTDYGRLNTTKLFLSELESVAGIPVTELIQSVRGGGPTIQGTWVHPKVAIHLAQWLSPRFAVQVSEWVYEWMTGGAAPKALMPYHLRRYVKNRPSVPDGHFSMLVEMTQLVIAPMEEAGYTLPERMLPDISTGKMFSGLLRSELNIDTATMPSYLHRFEDGRVVNARAYPDTYLPAFRKFMRERWIPRHAPKFRES